MLVGQSLCRDLKLNVSSQILRSKQSPVKCFLIKLSCPYYSKAFEMHGHHLNELFPYRVTIFTFQLQVYLWSICQFYFLKKKKDIKSNNFNWQPRNIFNFKLLSETIWYTGLFLPLFSLHLQTMLRSLEFAQTRLYFKRDTCNMRHWNSSSLKFASWQRGWKCRK